MVRQLHVLVQPRALVGELLVDPGQVRLVVLDAERSVEGWLADVSVGLDQVQAIDGAVLLEHQVVRHAILRLLQASQGGEWDAPWDSVVQSRVKLISFQFELVEAAASGIVMLLEDEHLSAQTS